MNYSKHAVSAILTLIFTVSLFAQSKGQLEAGETFAGVQILTGQLEAGETFAGVRISTVKEEFLPGEPIRLNIRFEKEKDVNRAVRDFSSTGRFAVFIARDRGEFLRYRFDGWTTSGKYNGQGPSLYSSDTIFFNSKPVTYHLSDYGRREAEKGLILTDYAFPEPGEYRVKATLGFTRFFANGQSSRRRIESNVISISVKQPEGDDLRVWEIMRADPRIGYFMMEGVVPYRFPSIEDTFLAEVDRITSEHPNSYLAGLLRVKAQEHRARRERIR